MENILKIENIEKYYGSKSSLTKAIDNISFEVEKGEFVAIMGSSGSGKTTLLNCISTIDKVTAGHIFVGGTDITKLKGNSLNKFRREDLGFIFQDFNLLDTLTAYENIALALSIQNVSPKEIDKRIKKVAKELDIESVLKKYPYQMSGGQKQRVAIARALVLNPEILLCDEATSALDPQITRDILSLLLKINKEMNITIVVVTHQMEVIKQICNKVAFLKDGRVLSVGKPEELFVAPNQEIQKFVGDDIEILPQTGKNIKLFFTNNNSKSHTITQLARTLDINFDICQGKLENFRGSMMGSLIINIDEKDLQAVGNYLDQEKITWEEIVWVMLF